MTPAPVITPPRPTRCPSSSLDIPVPPSLRQLSKCICVMLNDAPKFRLLIVGQFPDAPAVHGGHDGLVQSGFLGPPFRCLPERPEEAVELEHIVRRADGAVLLLLELQQEF